MPISPIRADVRAGKRQKAKSSKIRNGIRLLALPFFLSSVTAIPAPIPVDKEKEKTRIPDDISATASGSTQLEGGILDGAEDEYERKVIPKSRQHDSIDEIIDEVQQGSSKATIKSAQTEGGDAVLKQIQDDWYQGHISIPVSPHSHIPFEDHKNDLKGKGKAKDYSQSRFSTYPRMRRRDRSNGTVLRFNSQKSPFHSSQVGSLAARQPAILSVGLFQPDYPFIPSGRRKLREIDVNTRSRGIVNTSDTDIRAEKAPFAAIYTVPDEIANGNIFKHGWSTWMLDDELRLAVPDERRRPRKDSALMMAKNMIGKKWYRWQTGEGYVLCRLKNYSTYKEGPGIALGQLLPPRDHAYTSPLPLIPNDSKRDFVWLIFIWILILSLIAIVRETRNYLNKLRKGKKKSSLVEGAPLIPSIRIFDEGSSPLRTSSMDYVSIGLRTRQRTQAQHFRNLCKSAFSPMIGNSSKKRSSFSAADEGSLKLESLGWMKSGGEDEGKRSLNDSSKPVLPISNVSPLELKDPSLLNGTSRIAMRRSRSSSPNTFGKYNHKQIQQQNGITIGDEKVGFSGLRSSNSQTDDQNFENQSTTTGAAATIDGFMTKMNGNTSHHNRNLYTNGSIDYNSNESGGPKSIFTSMKRQATVSH